MGEVLVVGIRVEQPQNQPVLLLREANATDIEELLSFRNDPEVNRFMIRTV